MSTTEHEAGAVAPAVSLTRREFGPDHRAGEGDDLVAIEASRCEGTEQGGDLDVGVAVRCDATMAAS